MNKTALNSRHRELGAKMTDFHAWEMPLYFTSIIEEHRAVRDALGIFDIGHMGQLLLTGPDVIKTLNELVVSEISQVGEGRACYTLMLNADGGIIDDLIVYRLGEAEYLVIVNCGNRQSDFDWILKNLKGGAEVKNISSGRSILAIQGPKTCSVLERILDMRLAGLGRFQIMPVRTMGSDAYIARTGYTGSDGFELFLQDDCAIRLWDDVLKIGNSLGALPAGLGARDTLRIEAGLRLYGTDIDLTTSPYEAGLGWTVAINKQDFIGKSVLVKQKEQGILRQFVGFELAEGPVPRTGCELFANAKCVGRVTSGTFSPTLNKPLGMGYVDSQSAKAQTDITLKVRERQYAGKVVKLPFLRGERQQPVIRVDGHTITGSGKQKCSI